MKTLKQSKHIEFKHTSNNAYYEISNIKTYIKEGQEKLMQSYSDIKKSLSKLSLSFPSEHQDKFTSIITDLISMKESLKVYLNVISTSVSSLYENFLSENSTNSSDTLTLSPRIRSSYDLISEEFDKLEKVTKSIIETKHNLTNKRQKRVFLLEKKLQGLIEQTANTNFNELVKNYNHIETKLKNKDNISQIINKNHNNNIQKFSDIYIDGKNKETPINKDNYLKQQNIQSDKEIDTIIKGRKDEGGGEEETMIQLIETILSQK